MALQLLESLWFFSNILSPPSPPPTAEESIKMVAPPITEPQNPKQPTPNTEHEDSHSSCVQTVETRAGSELQMRTSFANIEQRRKESKGEQSRKRRNMFITETWDVQELREFRSGFRSEARSASALVAHRTSLQCGMHPLSDGAMKEHLKSWAHAVACTVR